MVKKFKIVLMLMLTIFMVSCGNTEESSSQVIDVSSDTIEISSVSSQTEEKYIPMEDELKELAKDIIFLETDSSQSNEYNNAITAFNEKIREELFYSDWDVYCPDYAIYDVTGDGIPELFLSINEAGIHKYIYTYKNGEVVDISANMGNGMHGSFYVYPNTIIYHHSSTGVTLFVTEIYENGTTKEFTFSRMVTGDPATEHYDYNGKKVTQEEYEKQWERYKYLTRDNAIKLEFFSMEEVLKENSLRFRELVA